MKQNESHNKIHRLAFTSDSHGKHIDPNIKGDMIFHSGDIVSNHYSLVSYTSFFKWFSDLKFRHKVFIAGNHDMLMEQKIFTKEHIFKEYGIIYLENESIEIDGIKIYGSPITPVFNDWFFMRERGESIKEEWDKIPEDTQILLTHGPPFGIGDNVNNELVGCKDLLDKVLTLKDLKIHSFGHVHEGYGKFICPQLVNTTFLNSSLLDGNYSFTNKPHIIECTL